MRALARAAVAVACMQLLAWVSIAGTWVAVRSDVMFERLGYWAFPNTWNRR